ELETSVHFGREAGLAREIEPARKKRALNAVVGIRAAPVVPPHDEAVNLPGDRQGHLAIALGRSCGLKIGDAGLFVTAAGITTVGGKCRHRAQDNGEHNSTYIA